MAEYLRNYYEDKGITKVVKKGDLEYIEFGVLRLDEGDVFAGNTADNEEVLIILSGKCSVAGKSFDFPDIGDRTNVFDGKPHSVYLPFNTAYRLTAVTEVEIAICRAPSDLQSEAVLITPEDVVTKTIGRDNWQRDANMIVDERINAKHLYIGEAIVPPGNWASFPPHRHDYDNLPHEVDMEEVYFFRFDQPQGFGIQKIYTDSRDLDETYTVRNNDTVMIPRGYHPVAAAPGYGMYYLWIMAGKNRKFLSGMDPEHCWITGV